MILVPGLAILAQQRLGASEKSCRLAEGPSRASSSLKLQWVPPERATVRHWLRDAEQSFGIAAVRRTVLSEQINGIILDPSLSQIFPPKRHSSSGRCRRNRETTSEGGARKEVRATPELDHISPEARHHCPAGFVRGSVRKAETAKQFDDHLCSRGYSTEDRTKCFKGLELEGLRLEEGEPTKGNRC